MDKLPLEIVNNILIIQYDEQIKELKKQLRSLKFNYDTREQQYNMDYVENMFQTVEDDCCYDYCEECRYG